MIEASVKKDTGEALHFVPRTSQGSITATGNSPEDGTTNCEVYATNPTTDSNVKIFQTASLQPKALKRQTAKRAVKRFSSKIKKYFSFFEKETTPNADIHRVRNLGTKPQRQNPAIAVPFLHLDKGNYRQGTPRVPPQASFLCYRPEFENTDFEFEETTSTLHHTATPNWATDSSLTLVSHPGLLAEKSGLDVGQVPKEDSEVTRPTPRRLEKFFCKGDLWKVKPNSGQDSKDFPSSKSSDSHILCPPSDKKWLEMVKFCEINFPSMASFNKFSRRVVGCKVNEEVDPETPTVHFGQSGSSNTKKLTPNDRKGCLKKPSTRFSTRPSTPPLSLKLSFEKELAELRSRSHIETSKYDKSVRALVVQAGRLFFHLSSVDQPVNDEIDAFVSQATEIRSLLQTDLNFGYALAERCDILEEAVAEFQVTGNLLLMSLKALESELFQTLLQIHSRGLVVEEARANIASLTKLIPDKMVSIKSKTALCHEKRIQVFDVLHEFCLHHWKGNPETFLQLCGQRDYEKTFALQTNLEDLELEMKDLILEFKKAAKINSDLHEYLYQSYEFLWHVVRKELGDGLTRLPSI